MIENVGGDGVMNFRKVNYFKIAYLAAAFVLLVAGFQNCSRPTKFGSVDSAQFSGNGDGYTGKPILFRRFDPGNPCSGKDSLGHALPNDQIFFQGDLNEPLKPHLVRNKCADIAPVELASADITLNAEGDKLSYKGMSFDGFRPAGDFDLVAASCPAGRTPKSGVTRTNLFFNSQDFSESPSGWNWHFGIVALLDGTIMSLPSYQLVRNDANNLQGYNRISQYPILQPNTEYTFSFLARKGSMSSISFRSYHAAPVDPNQNEYLIVDFDLNNGTYAVNGQYNLAAPEVSIVPMGNGYFCTIHYKTGVLPADSTDIGLAPSAGAYGAVGDSVIATAAQLVPTGQFCQ
jgi:hypothetical protein